MKMIMRSSPFFLAILLSAGCGMINRAKAPWEVITTEGPLSSAGQQASLETRQYWSSIMAAAASSDKRFAAPDGRHLDAWRTATRIVSFFEKKGLLKTWPETNARINSRAMVLAPYRIQIVSILPLVVILAEHDYGSTENRSIYDLVGERSYGQLSDDRIMNYIETGPTMPAADKLFWCSPDLNISITPVPVDADGNFLISHPNIVLVGRKAGTQIVFERKK